MKSAEKQSAHGKPAGGNENNGVKRCQRRHGNNEK